MSQNLAVDCWAVEHSYSFAYRGLHIGVTNGSCKREASDPVPDAITPNARSSNSRRTTQRLLVTQARNHISDFCERPVPPGNSEEPFLCREAVLLHEVVIGEIAAQPVGPVRL